MAQEERSDETGAKRCVDEWISEWWLIMLPRRRMVFECDVEGLGIGNEQPRLSSVPACSLHFVPPLFMGTHVIL